MGGETKYGYFARLSTCILQRSSTAGSHPRLSSGTGSAAAAQGQVSLLLLRLTSLPRRLSRSMYHKGAQAWVMLLQELAHGAKPAVCSLTEPDLEPELAPTEGLSKL